MIGTGWAKMKLVTYQGLHDLLNDDDADYNANIIRNAFARYLYN